MTTKMEYEDVVAKLDAAEFIIRAGEHLESHLEKQIDILMIDLEASMLREAALREELASANSYKEAYGQNAIDMRKEIQELQGVISDRIAGRNALQQCLTVAEQLLRETSDYLDGSTRNAVWCDSILHKKMKAALKPAAEGKDHVD